MGARTCADGVGAREREEMGGEKDRYMSEGGCADVCGRCGCKGGNGLGEGPGMDAQTCVVQGKG